jgi:glycerol-3-phosphate dehydrogenase (NAD(P)+)
MLGSRVVRQLPNHPIPDSIHITADFSEAVEDADGILISVPSHAFEDTLQAYNSFHHN